MSKMMTFEEFRNSKKSISNAVELVEYAHNTAYMEDLTILSCLNLAFIVYPGNLTISIYNDVTYYLILGNHEWTAIKGELDKIEKMEYELYKFYLSDRV